MRLFLPFIAALLFIGAPAYAFVAQNIDASAGETVTYQDGETLLEGYWVPARCGGANAPVVMIIHQWKGPGAYEKRRADMLAEKCYHAFVVDMYGKDVRPKDTKEAGAEAGKYKNDPALARRRITAALDYARGREGVDKDRIAVIGYCFGGTMALELARSGADIAAAISFHGGLSSKAPVTEKGAVKAAIQVHHGAADPHVPPAEVDGFTKEMDTAGADWMLASYAHAVHAFTEKEAGNDPSKGAAYDEKADKRSWEGALAFLSERLGR